MSTVANPPRSAPVKATWICLVIAWVLFLVPVPGLGMFGGWPLNLVAFILAIVVMTRGKVVPGLIPLLASVIISPIVYFVGLAIFTAVVGAGGYGDYVERAKATQEEVAAAVAQAEEAAPLVEAEQAVLAVTADTLFADYEANEVAADNIYKGKQLSVTGTVAGINKDFTDAIYVEVATANPFASIHARDIAPDVAAGLAKGSKVTIECVGDGLMMMSPILKGCQVK